MLLSCLAAAFTFTASATGVGKGTTVEFLFIGSDSDRDYEAMFTIDMPIPEFVKAIEKAGLKPGQAINPPLCQVWPVGTPVSFEPALSKFVSVDTADGFSIGRLVYTGGLRTADGTPVAANEMPAAVCSLYSLGQSVKSAMKEIEGVVDVNVEQQVSRPQIDIRPCREMMARFGITASDFQKFVNMVVGGEVVSQVYEDGLPYDLAVRVSDEQRSTINQISALTIDSNIGKIPLSYIADVVSTSGPNTINRENVSRRLLISANVDGRDLRGAVNEIKEEIEKDVKLPEGYFITYGGQFESEASASRTLAIASLGAILVIFLLLFHEFRNLRHSSIILLNMPLAMIGGIVILRLTSGELNIPAIIGFISLLGICTRNGMLLISRYNHYRSEGESLYNSVIKGSLDRLSPIMMTALTSALALVPIALRSGEPGNEIQSPLAIVILGGLVSATILNLIITPTVYYLIERRNENK